MSKFLYVCLRKIYNNIIIFLIFIFYFITIRLRRYLNFILLKEIKIINEKINYATKMVCNFYDNKIKPPSFLDSKRYLENYFTEKDMLINIKDEAIIYLCVFLEK